MAVKIVTSYSVSPSSGAAADLTLPLLYFDIVWLDTILTETLHFYPLKCSQSHFLDAVVVNLKHSLSLTLKQFLPLSSKIIFPLTSSAMPISRYTAGDALSLTIATSDDDFSHVVSSHPKPADYFHQLVAQMPAAVYSSEEIRFSPLAVQLTLFPNQGICIGFTHHHSICDATTLSAFLHTWASINTSNKFSNLLPFYGRDSVQDSNKLTIAQWNQMKANRPTVSLTLPLPSDKVRATFHLTDSQIEKLRSLVMTKKPSIGRPSTFVVVCAYIWSCLNKCGGGEIDDNETQYFGSPVNCRQRLNPPLPENYFGNCLIQFIAVSTHGTLKGDDGFIAAAEIVAAALKIAMKSTRVTEFFENRAQIFTEMKGKRVIRVVGSSKLDQCDADYGWGRAVKYECIHTDFYEAVHVCKDIKGGIELGLSMPKATMDMFADVFTKCLYINSKL